MDATRILKADVLDIIFENQNKEYGAYQLRKTYPARLGKALGGTALICLFLLFWYFWSRQESGVHSNLPVVTDAIMEKIPDPPRERIPVRAIMEPRKIETIPFMKPRIVQEDMVPKDQKPPAVNELDNAWIGNFLQHGDPDTGTSMPPSEKLGITEKPGKEMGKSPFIPVEIESEFPGGPGAWARFLESNLRYPEPAVQTGIQGDVLVRFMVNKDGNLSEVEALQGPQELREEAVRVIRKSGKWLPAIQNGQKVTSLKIQSIQFRLDSE